MLDTLNQHSIQLVLCRDVWFVVVWLYEAWCTQVCSRSYYHIFVVNIGLMEDRLDMKWVFQGWMVQYEASFSYLLCGGKFFLTIFFDTFYRFVVCVVQCIFEDLVENKFVHLGV